MLFALFVGEAHFPLMLGGSHHVEFVEQSGRALARKRGIFGKRTKIQPLLCGVAVDGGGGAAVTGTASGLLYMWQNGSVTKVTPAHQGAVYALAAGPEGVLASGGRDGVVRLWSPTLIELRSFEVVDAPEPPLSSSVHAVAFDRLGTKLLVAQRSGELFEVARESKRMLLLSEAHANKQLHGLATHPTDPDLYATCGDDATVAVWSISRRRRLMRTAPDLLGAAARAIAWSPDGKRLAVGLGGDPDSKVKDGAFYIIDASGTSLEVIHEDRKSKLLIRDIGFSPDAQTLAIASEDGKVYLHDANDYSLKTMCQKTGSNVIAFDFSSDASTLQLTTSADELLFYSARTGEPISSNASVRDVDWATISCPLGWHVQGVWPPDNDGVSCLTVHRSADRALLAKGDDAGGVAVFRYPCQTHDAGLVKCDGHASHVTRVRFTCDGKYLVSFTRETPTRGALRARL